MRFNRKQPDLSLLPSVFEKYDDIQAVYLFGSSITGKTHMESDVDMAIFPGTTKLKNKKRDLMTELARCGFDDVDLFFLDDQDMVMTFEAVRHNRLIYCKKGFDRGSLYSSVIRKYLTFYPYLAVQREAYKRRLLNGSQGSFTKASE